MRPATARSIEVAVASRWAAAMNASASWVLSVPSAWRSRAAIRASILSSAMAATLREEDDFPVRVPGLQIAMGLRRVVEREGPVDGDLDPAVAGERQQLRAGGVADLLAAVRAGQRGDSEFGGTSEAGDRRDPGSVGHQLDGGVQRLVGADQVQRGVHRPDRPDPVGQSGTVGDRVAPYFRS